MDPILSSILGPVCESVIDAAISEYRLVRDVKKDIRNLSTTVSMIKGVLDDAERKQVESGAIREWLKSLKQVLLDAEDVFDEIATDEALGITKDEVTRRLSKVLNLDGCRWLSALPKKMSALTNLRHLIVDDYHGLVSGIEGLGKLTALQELGDFDCARRGMEELADMGMLRRLRIRCLEKVKSKGVAIQSRLDKKEHLDDLTLEWGGYGRDHHDQIDPGAEEEVLDGLQPPAGSIRRLRISNYGGIRSPSWMEEDRSSSWVRDSCFLETLELGHCANWEVLPPLGQLLCLNSLKISGMRSVRRIGPEFMGGCYALEEEEGAVDQVPFPSLQVLELEDMEEWEEWDQAPHGTDEDDQVSVQVPPPPPPPRRQHRHHPMYLPRLRELTIVNCPKLRQLPPLPLPELVKLIIEDCQGLVSLPETAFGHLTSLKELEVRGCPKLSWPSSSESLEEDSLPPSLERITIGGGGVNAGEAATDHMMLAIIVGSQKLTCLRYLRIEGCGFSWPSPPPPTTLVGEFVRLPSSLQELTIHNSDHLDDETLSALLRGLTSLTNLCIQECPAVTSLPRAEVLSHLTALESLEIRDLKALKSFGGGVRSLPSLGTLTIGDCPELLDIIIMTAAADSSSPSSSAPLPRPPAGMGTTPPIRTLEIWGSSMQQIKTWLLRCPSVLHHLSINNCPQLTRFSGGGDDELEAALLDLSGTLKELVFYECENLRSLPPRLSCLSSLGTLRIHSCPKIRSLPAAGLPESLRFLEIDGCRALQKRCRKGEGSNWPLISHIPNLRI